MMHVYAKGFLHFILAVGHTLPHYASRAHVVIIIYHQGGFFRAWFSLPNQFISLHNVNNANVNILTA